jgi:hypothetical protein
MHWVYYVAAVAAVIVLANIVFILVMARVSRERE